VGIQVTNGIDYAHNITPRPPPPVQHKGGEQNATTPQHGHIHPKPTLSSASSSFSSSSSLAAFSSSSFLVCAE
jgi:hypothetical protein